jgi:hypothetical protein
LSVLRPSSVNVLNMMYVPMNPFPP